MTADGTKQEGTKTIGELMQESQFMSLRYVKSLDVMLARGIYVPAPDGCPESWPDTLRFMPLTLNDLAEMTQRRKAQALRVYHREVYDATKRASTRFQDMHNILHRTCIPEDLSIADPFNLLNMVQLSLTRGHAGKWHPTIDDCDQLLMNESFRQYVMDIISIETWGPTDTEAIAERQTTDGEPNPT